MPIQILDPYLASQIAAGEVIERPASVLKELLENSIDARATELEINIQKAGSSLIQVRDNGSGIPKDELQLALHRHATSKIQKFDDLEKIMSLGFRGEALASIGSVSRLTLASRTSNQDLGWRITTEGREPQMDLKPISHPLGTTIEVRDLFFNTPARRKFLRSDQTEFRQLVEVVTRLSLSNFDIEFTLKHNDKVYLKLPKAKTVAEKSARISETCDSEFAKEMLEVNTERNGLKLTGWVCKPTLARAKTDLQYFYINGRIVRDKVLNHALRLAYQDVISHSKQPAFILYLEIDPEFVDVNVHPTKHEVRFRDSRMIHDFLVYALTSRLEKTTDDSLNISSNQEILINNQKVQDIKNLQLHEAVLNPFDVLITEEIPLPIPEICKQNYDINQQVNFKKPQKEIPYSTMHYSHSPDSLNLENEKQNSELVQKDAWCDTKFLGHALAQLQGIYILAQNSKGLIIVDAHAAHERITYEKLKESFDQNSLQSQVLLIPLTIAVTRQEIVCVEEYKQELQKLGLDLECLGNNTIAIRQIPALLRDADLEDFIHEILTDLTEFSESSRSQNYINKILATFACHYSIRANRKMTIPEMNELLRQLEKTARGEQCNHGRPTWFQITCEEIKKKFCR